MNEKTEKEIATMLQKVNIRFPQQKAMMRQLYEFPVFVILTSLTGAGRAGVQM
jgi:hypothetical protein